MRIQIASDLHLEVITRHFPRERLIQPAPEAELLVLAGDIHNGSAALDLFRDWPVPVVYVAGNHEFYDGSITTVLQELESESKGTPIHFLERQSYVTGDLRILGCTLWTDYQLYGSDEESQRCAQNYSNAHLCDRRAITSGSGCPFTAQLALEEHKRARSWLASELRRPFAGKTLVVTHHAPHPLSISEKYQGSPSNPAFVSDLGDLIGGAQLWIHGHCHDTADYRIGDCRIVANPRGYARWSDAPEAASELTFENPRFAPNLVIHI
ncbi:metallophosphoesterase [Burkholderia glumae]